MTASPTDTLAWNETDRYQRRWRGFVSPAQLEQFGEAYRQLWLAYAAYTMIPEPLYRDNLALVHQQLLRMEGAVVECGTWKGGMAAGMLQLGGPTRSYAFFDSFEGLPPAQGIDGGDAQAWQADTQAESYFDNCRADVEAFRDLMASCDVPMEQIAIHKGWFEDTVGRYDGPPIAVLRLDGDWYDSTMTCLRALYPHVLADGIIILDDYDTWDGCSRAVHDYLAEIKSTARIKRSGDSQIAFIHKLDDGIQ